MAKYTYKFNGDQYVISDQQDKIIVTTVDKLQADFIVNTLKKAGHSVKKIEDKPIDQPKRYQ